MPFIIIDVTSECHAATLVKIGLQQTSYTVIEDNTIVLMCTAIESGSIAGRTIAIDYQTTDGSALGKVIHVL